MPKVKVLPLEFWMECTPFNDDPKYARWGEPCSEHMKKAYPETVTVFNRDGMYRHGDKAWFEINGKAFVLDVDAFDHALNTEHGKELTDEKFEALCAIIKVGLSTAEQRKMARFAAHAKECRAIYRSTRKQMLDIFPR